MRSPLVIAMWEPMARALGYPKKKLGFADVLRLSTSGKGWAEFGRPEFGDFKLVHTSPDFSTSGLSFVVAEYYAALGKKEGLTEQDIGNGAARKRVRDIERSIVHYGDTTLFIANQLHKEGPGYASAIAMEEVTLLEYNRDRKGGDKLVAIYPEEGTFDSDSPFFTLKAPWVSAEQAAGAKAFQQYLAEEITPEVASKAFFRPSNRETPPVAPITVANGADPKQPERVLALPEPRVLAAIKKAWRRDRKPANIMLVVDTSGSMNAEGRLSQAKAGLEVFFRGVEPQDSVGLTIFSDQIKPLIEPAPMSKNRAELRARVRSLIAEGGTAFYDATVESFDAVRAQKANGPHQRRRAAHRRGRHGLAAHRRRGRRAPRGPGRLGQPRAACSRSPTPRARPARAPSSRGSPRPRAPRATRARRRTSSRSTARSRPSSSR